MTERIAVAHLALVPHGRSLSLSISAGQLLAVAGPASSGKSRLLRTLTGLERPSEGSIRVLGSAHYAGMGSLGRRTKPRALLAPLNNSTKRDYGNLLLAACGLADERDRPISDLGESHRAGAELLGALVADSDITALDGQLDHLDPWTLAKVMDILRDRRRLGGTQLIATNRPDLIRQADALIVVRNQEVRFAGTTADLLRLGPRHSISITTENRPGVRALVGPFEVHVNAEGPAVRLESSEGQEVAARLLLEGYGDVKFIVDEAPTIEESLLSLQ